MVGYIYIYVYIHVIMPKSLMATYSALKINASLTLAVCSCRVQALGCGIMFSFSTMKKTVLKTKCCKILLYCLPHYTRAAEAMLLIVAVRSIYKATDERMQSQQPSGTLNIGYSNVANRKTQQHKLHNARHQGTHKTINP